MSCEILNILAGPRTTSTYVVLSSNNCLAPFIMSSVLSAIWTKLLKTLVKLTTRLANQWLNLIAVGYLHSGQIFIDQKEFNQWLANHWLSDTNHWFNDLTKG